MTTSSECAPLAIHVGTFVKSPARESSPSTMQHKRRVICSQKKYHAGKLAFVALADTWPESRLTMQTDSALSEK